MVVTEWPLIPSRLSFSLVPSGLGGYSSKPRIAQPIMSLFVLIVSCTTPVLILSHTAPGYRQHRESYGDGGDTSFVQDQVFLSNRRPRRSRELCKYLSCPNGIWSVCSTQVPLRILCCVYDIRVPVGPYLLVCNECGGDGYVFYVQVSILIILKVVVDS